MPVAVAGLLTFLLNPIVRLFERWLPRAVAVLVVVVLTFSVLGALSWALAVQAASLGGEIPVYRDNLKRKIAEIRGASRGTRDREGAVRDEGGRGGAPEGGLAGQGGREARAGRGEAADLHLLWQPAVVEALGNVGLVLVLVIFMLLERLQLRDRLIRVIGFGRIATTTKAMDEAAQRITHYLTMQTLINGTFGVGVALGGPRDRSPLRLPVGLAGGSAALHPLRRALGGRRRRRPRRARGVRWVAAAAPDRRDVRRAGAVHEPRAGDVPLQPERGRLPGRAPARGGLLDVDLGPDRTRPGDAPDGLPRRPREVRARSGGGGRS